MFYSFLPDPVITRKAEKYFTHAEDQTIVRKAISQEDLSGIDTVIAKLSPATGKKSTAATNGKRTDKKGTFSGQQSKSRIPMKAKPSVNRDNEPTNGSVTMETLTNHSCVMQNGSPAHHQVATQRDAGGGKAKKKTYEAFVMTGDLILNLNAQKTSPKFGKRRSMDVSSPEEESKTAPCSPAQVLEEKKRKQENQVIGSSNYARTSRSENFLEKDSELQSVSIDLDDVSATSFNALHYPRPDSAESTDQRIVWTVNAPLSPEKPPESKITVGYYKDIMLAEKRALQEKQRLQQPKTEQVTVTVRTVGKDHHMTLSDGDLDSPPTDTRQINELCIIENIESLPPPSPLKQTDEVTRPIREDKEALDQVVPGEEELPESPMDFEDLPPPPPPLTDIQYSSRTSSPDLPPSSPVSTSHTQTSAENIIQIEESVQTDNLFSEISTPVETRPKNTTSTWVQTDDSLLLMEVTKQNPVSQDSPKRLKSSPKGSPSKSKIRRSASEEARTPTPPCDWETESRMESPPPLPGVPGVTEGYAAGEIR